MPPCDTGCRLYDVLHDLYMPFLWEYRSLVGSYIVILCVLYFLQTILFPRALTFLVRQDLSAAKQKSKASVISLLSIAFAIILVSYIKSHFDAVLPTKQFQMIRQYLYERLLTVLQTQVQPVRLGEFITLVNYLPREIRYMTENVIQMTPAIFGYLFVWGYAVMCDRRAGVVFGVGVVVSFLFAFGSPWSGRLAEETRQRAQSIMTNNSSMSEDIQQLDQIYANNRMHEKKKQHSDRESMLQSIFQKSVNTSNQIFLVLAVWNTLVFLGTGWFVYKGDRTPDRSVFKMFVTILGFFMGTLWTLLSRFMTLIMASESVKIYYDTFLAMLCHEAVPSGTVAPSGDLDAAFVSDRTIGLHDIVFRYSESSPWILSGFDWTIPDGSRWVLMGPSGQGKSTVLKLIMRFFPPFAGSIIFGGSPIESYSLESLRNIMCYIPQDTPLFEKSIYENIVFGNEDIPRERVKEEWDRYGLLDIFRNDLSETADHILDRSCGVDGKNLSKGQQKIITLTRALFRHQSVSIFLMDEPLASLDRDTQKKILRWIVDGTQKKTIIITTHITDHAFFRDFQIRTLH